MHPQIETHIRTLAKEAVTEAISQGWTPSGTRRPDDYEIPYGDWDWLWESAQERDEDNDRTAFLADGDRVWVDDEAVVKMFAAAYDEAVAEEFERLQKARLSEFEDVHLGFEFTEGRDTTTGDIFRGTLRIAGVLRAFASAAARDAWVEEVDGSYDTRRSRYRDAVAVTPQTLPSGWGPQDIEDALEEMEKEDIYSAMYDIAP